MPGETEEKQSAWTTDTLHVHLSRRIDDLMRNLDERHGSSQRALDAALEAAEKAVAAALSSAEKAVSKAEAAAEKRFEATNEFRAELSDRTATFMARSEAEVRFVALAEKLEQHTRLSAERLTQIERRLDLSQGNRQGADQLWQYAIAAVGVIALLIGVVSFFNAG